jgi:hypothetical protein
MATYLLPWGAPLSQPVPDDTTPLPRPTSYQFKTDVALYLGCYLQRTPRAQGFRASQEMVFL